MNKRAMIHGLHMMRAAIGHGCDYDCRTGKRLLSTIKTIGYHLRCSASIDALMKTKNGCVMMIILHKN